METDLLSDLAIDWKPSAGLSAEGVVSVAARYRVMTELRRAGRPVGRADLQRRLPADADLDGAIDWLERRGLVRSRLGVVAPC